MRKLDMVTVTRAFSWQLWNVTASHLLLEASVSCLYPASTVSNGAFIKLVGDSEVFRLTENGKYTGYLLIPQLAKHSKRKHNVR